MTVTVGIDPGIDGAIAAVQDGTRLLYLCDMPTITENRGGKDKRSVNGAAVATAIGDIIAACPHEDIHVCIEHVSSSPQMGVTSAFSFGHSFGIMEGVVQAKRLPLHRVRPALWKKAMKYTSDKETIRADMIRMFPGAELHLKRHADRAEAIALAIYLYKDQFA